MQYLIIKFSYIGLNPIWHLMKKSKVLFSTHFSYFSIVHFYNTDFIYSFRVISIIIFKVKSPHIIAYPLILIFSRLFLASILSFFSSFFFNNESFVIIFLLFFFALKGINCYFKLFSHFFYLKKDQSI